MKKDEFIQLMTEKGYSLKDDTLSSGLHRITIKDDDKVVDSSPAGMGWYDSFDDFINNKRTSYKSYGSLD